jgi:hypothetical protein
LKGGKGGATELLMVGPGDGREVGVADGVDVGVHRVHVVRHVAAGMMGHAWVSQPTHTEVSKGGRTHLSRANPANWGAFHAMM